MKIAILGSTGMAGHMVAAYMEQQGFQVYRISRSEENSERSCRIDVTEFNTLTKYISKIGANVIINCVGLLQATCERRPDLAILVNSYLPHLLANQYQNTSVKIYQPIAYFLAYGVGIQKMIYRMVEPCMTGQKH